MNCHQIVSGACNAGDRCFAVGSVEGVSFTAYAAGCNIVILASNFERVQIIPGAVHGYIRISSLDCSTDTGKIAAAYENTVCIFEPTPLIHGSSSHGLEYRWVQTGSLRSDSYIACLSWNLEGTRLLTGGIILQLWQQPHPEHFEEIHGGVTFELGEPATETMHEEKDNTSNASGDAGGVATGGWECVWNCKTATPVHHMAFSPDGTLFATAGRNDRLVKIWFENKFVMLPQSRSMDHTSTLTNELQYGFVYIAHPRAVTHLAWRRTSKYMPKGSVANTLVTSCLDNICRVWLETVPPDDSGSGGIPGVNMEPGRRAKYRAHRHKHRFVQRLKHMKTCFHIRRHAKQQSFGQQSGVGNTPPIPTLPSTYSVHDFHSYGYHGSGVSAGLHFHLAASINAETDIPLVPSLGIVTGTNHGDGHSAPPSFVLHWLDNKEMHFSLQAEALLHDLTKKVLETDEDPEITYKKRSGTSEDGTSGCESGLDSSLDARIESLLRDWHHSPDLLFSVHPIDGSFLIWMIEWLDEFHPGSFRQAQVSFSTRIPGAFPLGDAMSMSTNVSLYHASGLHAIHLKDAIRHIHKNEIKTGVEAGSGSPLPKVLEEDSESAELQNTAESTHVSLQQAVSKIENANNEQQQNSTTSQSDAVNPAPTISMVSKHSNGTLNLWELTFADKSKFSQVLSIAHSSRASGHRFRVNDITCHPVLPLLLTTSHHNMPDKNREKKPENNNGNNSGFCSELILWRVDAVGPLSKSGGVNELARINSPQISAFSNVAWIPTLLPSTTLGNLSNSPSACFVASDGESLRVYQAVIDARTLLAEISISERRSRLRASASLDSLSSHEADSSDDGLHHHFPLHDKIKIVSEQSTARPGCVIQLDAIADATHDWQNTQFLHVFQEQLITGERVIDSGTLEERRTSEIGLTEAQQHGGAMVDLHRTSEFEEPFYIVVLERTMNGTTVHMWRLVIASQPDPVEAGQGLTGSMMYVPDSDLVQDDDEADRDSGTDVQGDGNGINPCAPHVTISTRKVCEQALPLPDGVEVVHAAPAAGHLSSASIYPACLAPYVLVTACSDSTVRFWKCGDDYKWKQWEMVRREQESTIDIGGQPLNVCAAYSGRVACAYKYGRSFTRPGKADPESRYVNLCVAIYECESTGGSEWVLEDTIHLKNIHLPRIQIDPHLDLSYLYDSKYLQKKQRLTQVLHTLSHDEPRQRNNDLQVATEPIKPGSSTLLAVPSFSTLQSLRKSISENGNTCPLTQKHLVQLDWVSKEDGSHVLTVAVGSKIMLFTPVSSDLAQANMKAMKESQSTNRPILRKASSLAQPHFVDEIRWMKLRKILLETADGLPPLPMQISWVRDGILVVGMDSEMHVYTQWKPRKPSWNMNNLQNGNDTEESQDTRQLRDVDLRVLVQESTQRRLGPTTSMTHLSRVSSVNLQILSSDSRKKRTGNTNTGPAASTDYMPDYGLFEASRIACPVLPQYHPKQLMELLNSGKIRWVKAILAHLVRCIGGPGMRPGLTEDEESSVARGWSRARTLSVGCGVAGSPEPRGSTAGTTQLPDDMICLDYAEISSIPPLPLWTLLAADREKTGSATNDEQPGYDELFDGAPAEDSLDDILEDDEMDKSISRRTDRRGSLPERQSLAHFGPRQGRTLSRLLTHTHLPGLSSLDQMHLLALADTVATCNTDLAERFAIDAAKTALAKENLHGVVQSDDMSTDSLDECGLRFLLAMKHYGYLLRCLPLAQRAQFQRQGVGTNNLAWAYHSESQNELLNLIPSYAKGQPKWVTLKELGVGWWLRSNTLLKTCVEKLAKAAYQANQDPLDAAIYYLAMKKKSVVWGLFRSQRDDRMTAFFSNNFAEERWRKAALKNAFALLGKQRFDHAAAFFLLAGALRDAIDVCLNKLDDLQLAMVIARLYEGELDAAPNSLKRLLYEEILGCDAQGNNFDITKAHPDPFLRSMALWTLKDHQAALSTLLVGGAGSMHPSTPNDDITPSRSESNSADPNVFNFYVYLRTHPLIVRQHVAMSAQDRKKASHLVLSGFSYSSKHTENTDKQILLEDTITPLERQLYFTTAHGHFKAGCPALALDVLSKLPAKVADNSLSQQESLDSPGILKSPLKSQQQNIQIDSGMLSWNDQQSKTDDVPQKADSIDWGSSMVANTMAQADSFDWSAPVTNMTTDDLELKWDDDENVSEKSGDSTPPIALKLDEKEKSSSRDDDAICTASSPSQSGGHLDIMAQQLKFVACLKILMEELSTLATGFEVDGGQLRYQLYIWLEHEVEALRQLCNYSASATGRDPSDPNETIAQDESVLNEQEVIPIKEEKLTLHEILMQEKLDFEAKVQRAARRKRWLKANETLLRTLVSYCSLHGAAGGGLASVRMELVLLLQELQQEKTQQQLFSPLPFPTTLPLLSASVACSKTVVADPVRHLQQTTDVKEQIKHWMQVQLESPASNMVVYILQAHAHDMLQIFIEFNSVPQSGDADSQILVLRDLAVALSACIYQCLCDSDSFSTKQAVACDRFSSAGMESLARISGYGVAHHLVGGRSRLSTDEPLIATTPPARWPGVASLRALLARERDDDAPRLGVLLSESFVAVYSALLVYALSTCDAQILYRIVAHNFDERTWSLLFGGGVKKLLRTASNQSNTERERQVSESSTDGVSGVWGSLAKQRARLNQRLLGQAGTPPNAGNMKEDKPTYREQFVPPVMSMISYFLAKPEDVDCDYDSAESCATESDHESTDDEDVFGTDIPTTNGSTNASLRKRKVSKDNMQHADPKSLAWAIMRHAVLKIAHLQLTKFLPITGLEAHELPVSSPLIHNALRTISRWQEMSRADLESRGQSPPDFIPGCFVEQQPGPAIHKYRQLLEPHNTPFSTRHQAASARRLWTFLVRQEPVQDVFIRAVFSKRRSMCAICEPPPPLSDESTPGTGATSPDGPPQHHSDPVRIIHKEQDSISAFCLNQVNNGLLALATPREIQEMDISLLLELPAWLEDECELDILSLSMKSDSGTQTQPSSFLVIQTPSDRIPGTPTQQGNSVPPSPQPQVAGQSGRGTSVVLKHKIDGVRRISAHPLLPLYLTGSQDGSVQLWEWGHTQPVSTPRPPGTFAKVTRVRFSQHGNKFGVADSDGNLSLWQLGLTSNNNRPFFTYQCHNKGISDFVFLGSCSLIATAGHSSENKNVALWDTLLPQKKSLVIAFTCHEQGASSLVFAPQHQLLISAGKKGDISLLDVRARALRHRFVAHESPVKCLAIDPQEEFFVTGSADGDIKVWGLSAHSLLMSLPGEHARGSFFKNIGQGVTQLHVDNAGRLFSCGADGSMKFRQLPDRDIVVQSSLS